MPLTHSLSLPNKRALNLYKCSRGDPMNGVLLRPSASDYVPLKLNMSGYQCNSSARGQNIKKWCLQKANFRVVCAHHVPSLNQLTVWEMFLSPEMLLLQAGNWLGEPQWVHSSYFCVFCVLCYVCYVCILRDPSRMCRFIKQKKTINIQGQNMMMIWNQLWDTGEQPCLNSIASITNCCQIHGWVHNMHFICLYRCFCFVHDLCPLSAVLMTTQVHWLK